MTRSKIRTSGAEGLTLSSTSLTIANGLTLTDGDIAFADGHGLSFAATSDAGVSTPNELLDDYEEGTWTPTISFNTSGTVSYSRQDGSYTKVGRMILIEFALIFDVSSANGIIVLGGFPFAQGVVGPTNNDRSVLNLGYIDNINADDFSFLMTGGGSTANAYRYNGTQKTDSVTHSQLINDGGLFNIHGSGVYKTS